jgi:hypothetical protein
MNNVNESSTDYQSAEYAPRLPSGVLLEADDSPFGLDLLVIRKNCSRHSNAEFMKIKDLR